MKKFLALVVLAMMSSSTFAQLSLNGEIRPRFEYRDGYKTLKLDNTDPARFISQRTRLGLTYKTDLYTTHISFQDVRTWGSEALKSNTISAALCEAWVDFNMTTNFNIKIGRQALKYDNQRLMGGANWNQIGAQHDAVKFAYHKNKFEFEAVGAYNQSTESTKEVPYNLFNKLYQGLALIWAKQSFDNFSLAHMSVIESNRMDDISDKAHSRYTTGLIFNFKKNKFNTDLRTFYQGGKTNTGTKIAAYYFNLELAYKATKRLNAKAGFDFLSGNDEPGVIGDKENAFNTIYGGRHIFNGSMDYFLTPSSTRGMGLIDWSIGMSYKVCPKMTAKIDYHYFRTHRDFSYNNKAYSAYLGSEIDLQANIKFTKEISFMLMYGLMLPTETMAVAKNVTEDAKTGHALIMMLTFKPKFLVK